MYGAPYAPGAVPPPTRPNALTIGTGAILVTIVACLAETAFEVLLFNSFTDALSASDSTGSVAGSLRPYLISTILLNALVAVALGIATPLMLQRRNAGRVLNWSAGGVCALVRMCCLSGMGGFSLIAAEVNRSAGDTTMSNMAPGWQIGGAAICSSIALIAVVVGMIITGAPTVNRWFRVARQVQQPAAPAPGYYRY